VYISVYMLPVRVNEDGTQTKSKNVRSKLKKKLFQDDYLFEMRLKGLKLSQIILQYVNIHPAKFDFDLKKTIVYSLNVFI